MSVLDRKLVRDLRSARTMLVSIMLVIVVGIGCFVGMTSVYTNLETARRAYYAQCRMADFWVDVKRAPAPVVARLREVRGVAEVQPRIAFHATIDLEHVSAPLNGQVISLPEEGGGLNGVVMVRGSGFTDERLEQVIVNDAFARARGVHPGDRIHVILNNRRQQLFVVGTAVGSEFVYLINPGGLVPDPEQYGVFYVKSRFAEEVLDFDGACNQIVGRLTPDWRDRPHRILDEVERRLEPFGVLVSTPLAQHPSHQILTDELSQLRATAVILPAIFLIVAVLVLNILMSRLAEQQRTTVGTLKALGYTNTELMQHYLKFGALVGLVGGVAGAVAGYWLAVGLIVSYRTWFEFPNLDDRAVPWVYFVALLLAIVFALLGTIRGVRSVVRLSPSEAMRAKPPVSVGRVWLERYSAVWRRLDFRWRMVVRSVSRHKWRTGAGIFAAAMGSTIMFTSFYFLDSMQELVEFQFEKVVLSDVDLTFREKLDRGALLEARRLPGVDYAEPLFQIPCEFQNGHRSKRSGIIGVTPEARLTVARRADGTPVPVPPSGLLMSRRLASRLDVQRGEEVTIVPIEGSREPRRASVSGIVDGFLGMATYADYDWLNRLVDEGAAVSAVQLQTSGDPEQRGQLLRALKGLPTLQAVIDNRRMKVKLVTTLLDTLRYAIVALLLMAAVIFLGSILTTSLIALSERRREVATFLVIGYERSEVAGIFLRESLIVNVVGTLAGLPLGLWLSMGLIEGHDREAFRLPVVSSPASFVVTVVLGVLFTVLAHAVVHRAVVRLDWLEALNAKE